MTISTGVKPVSPAPDVVSDAPEQFRRPEGIETVTTNNPLTKAALVTLYEAQCRSLPFQALWDKVRSRLGARFDEIAGEEEGRRDLGESLLRCFGSGLLDFHVHPPRFASEPGERPVASPLARLQAETEETVTNLRGRAVQLDDFHGLILQRLDGTRDLSQLAEEIKSLFLAGDFTIEQGGQPVQDPAMIEAMIGPEIEPTVRTAGRAGALWSVELGGHLASRGRSEDVIHRVGIAEALGSCRGGDPREWPLPCGRQARGSPGHAPRASPPIRQGRGSSGSE